MGRPSVYKRYTTTDIQAQPDKLTRINNLLDEIIGEYIAGNEFNKLNYLNDIKNNIANAIRTKGQSVDPYDTFMSYADKILAIETQQETKPEPCYIVSMDSFGCPEDISTFVELIE